MLINDCVKFSHRLEVIPFGRKLQHEDFGEKIGGAKKDLWKDRGLYVDDLGSMNEREAEKFVKKDNVWKKPD